MSNEEFRDLVIVGLVVLALGVSALYWIANVMEKQDAEKRYVDHNEDFCEVPSPEYQATVAAQHCAKVNAKRAEVRNG